MTQEELALELGVTPVTVCRWETGKVEPSNSYLNSDYIFHNIILTSSCYSVKRIYGISRIFYKQMFLFLLTTLRLYDIIQEYRENVPVLFFMP